MIIGQILSMKYVGKKRWETAILYGIMAWVLWIFVIIFARYAYPKMPWVSAIKVWIVGFVINLIILLVLWSVLLSSFITLPQAMWPFSSLFGF